MLVGVLVLALWVVPPAQAGLYDDDATKVTGGDLVDRDYWRAKWNSEQLDIAIQQQQPEGAILLELIGDISLLDDLLKKYPNDDELKQWRAHAVEVKGKIDPDADRGASFKAGSTWAEHNLREAYVGLNCGRAAVKKEDWQTAHSCLQDASRDLDILRERIKNNDRVAAWPPNLASWIKNSSTEVASMNDTVDQKLK
jgi:hypothetical protein